MSDHYSTLGIDKTASKDEIRKAFHRKAKSAHPDTGGSQEAFQALELAHRILSDDDMRAHYDATGESSLPDLEAMANSIIREIVLKVINQAGDKTVYLDLDHILRTNIKQGLSSAEQELNDAERKIKRLERIASRVRSKQRNIDIMTAVINDQISLLQQEIKSRGTHIEVLKLALALCETFHFDPEEMEPEPTVMSSYTASTSTGGWFFR